MTPPANETDGSDVAVTADADGDADDQAPDGGRTDPAEAFGALSDPLRVAILRELAAFHRETGEKPVGFAELRKRVDVRDSGRFRYHLNELRDAFVEKADGGYRLTPAGFEIVAAILAGTYTDRQSRGPEPLDSDCSECGSTALAGYEDGVCVVTCDEDHPLFQWSVPPAATADATLQEVVTLAELLAHQAIERALAGVCPKCFAPVDPAVDVETDRSPPRLRVACDTCGGRLVGPAGFCLLVDPQVAAFYRRHDRPLRDRHVWEPAFVADESTHTVTGTDPARVDFEVSVGGETLAVTVDDAGQVVAVDRSDRDDGDATST